MQASYKISEIIYKEEQAKAQAADAAKESAPQNGESQAAPKDDAIDAEVDNS